MPDNFQLSDAISCCHCFEVFSMSEAEMCDGCNPCDQCRGARSVDECCLFRNCCSHTLVCPFCNRCACDHVEKWERENRLVRLQGHERFTWVHQDQIVA